MKYVIRGVLVCFLGTAFGVCADQAFSQTIELKMSHFMPTKHVQHSAVMEPWAKKVEAQSGGKLKVTIYPGGALGKPPQQYDNAVKGITDIAFGLHSYTPGRFPLTSVLRLPFMVNSAQQGSIALWKLYEKDLGSEFEDAKILWLFCHGPGHIHTTKKQVRTLEDMKGLKIRSPGPIMSKVLLKLNAVPVTMPITEVYTALERGTVDGVAAPWETMRPFRFHELCKHSTEVNIYTQTFFVAMNKDKYASLPAELRSILDANSGEKMSALAGRAYDEDDIPGRKLAQEKGITIYQIPDKEKMRWIEATRPVVDEWLKEMSDKGLPGKNVYDDAKGFLK